MSSRERIVLFFPHSCWSGGACECTCSLAPKMWMHQSDHFKLWNPEQWRFFFTAFIGMNGRHVWIWYPAIIINPQNSHHLNTSAFKEMHPKPAQVAKPGFEINHKRGQSTWNQVEPTQFKWTTAAVPIPSLVYQLNVHHYYRKGTTHKRTHTCCNSCMMLFFFFSNLHKQQLWNRNEQLYVGIQTENKAAVCVGGTVLFMVLVWEQNRIQ